MISTLVFTIIVGVVIKVRGDTLCPDGWMAYKGSCFLFEERLLDFTQAEQFCRGLRGHLVHVKNRDENAFIKGELQRRKWQAWWLGCTDEVEENTWKWTDFQTTMLPNETDWHIGQPNNDGDCAVFLQPYGFQWEDTDCLSKVMPICQRSGMS